MKTTIFSEIARAVRKFYSGRQNGSESRFKYIIHEGWVWDADKLSLLEKAKEAVSQLWINKANAYLGELCLKFKCSPENLSKKLWHWWVS